MDSDEELVESRTLGATIKELGSVLDEVLGEVQ